MWQVYLGEKAHIYGVDIDPRCQAYAEDGIRVLIGDQADREFWQHFRQEVPRLDVVIDDGGHQAVQQTATLESLLSHMEPGGVYICEDIHGRSNPFLSYLDAFARHLHTGNINWDQSETIVDVTGSTIRGHAEANGLQQIVDSVHFYPFLSVIERRVAALDHFEASMHGTE
jgi:hypothetical protein